MFERRLGRFGRMACLKQGFVGMVAREEGSERLVDTPAARGKSCIVPPVGQLTTPSFQFRRPRVARRVVPVWLGYRL